MKTLSFKAWTNFQREVSSLDENSPPRHVLGVIMNFIRSNHEVFMNEPFSIYGFDHLMRIDEATMPVEFAPLKLKDINHFRRITLKYKFRNTKSIAMFLRNSIENLITIEADIKCPVCKSWGMMPFIGKYNHLLAYQCRTCSYARYSNGEKVEFGDFEYATMKNLREGLQNLSSPSLDACKLLIRMRRNLRKQGCVDPP